jgi:UDP-N-acetylglucosamine 4,6-dehydratase (inverting)
MFNDSSILVTGGTGSFGQAFARSVLTRYPRSKVIVLSRDEMKQWQMAKDFGEDSRIRFFVGDVRDRDRLYRAFDGVDYVVHAAASKIVPTAEYNPFEAVKTNILGAMNVVDAAIDRQVKKVVTLSTDKASSPSNLYGATKLVSDKLFLAANSYSGGAGTLFCGVRYGNVIGSRGSVIPLFQERIRAGLPLQITDSRMSRFMISLDAGIALVEKALEATRGNEIFVKKIPSMTVTDIADSLDPGGKREIIGMRPGEKLHEQMISEEDSFYTWEFSDHFRILSPTSLPDYGLLRSQGGWPVDEGFTYRSDTNPERMSAEALAAWLGCGQGRP